MFEQLPASETLIFDGDGLEMIKQHLRRHEAGGGPAGKLPSAHFILVILRTFMLVTTTRRFPQDREWRPEKRRTRSASALRLSYAAFDKPFQCVPLKRATHPHPVLLRLNCGNGTAIPKARDVGDGEVSPRLSMPY